MTLYVPRTHGRLTDVTSDQHHPRSHDHSSASDGVTLSLAGGLNLTSVISPAQITADQNDWNPNGKDTAFLWRLDSDAQRTITGIVAPAVGGALHWVTYVGATSVILAHNSGSSSAANRLNLPNNASWIVSANDSVLLLYDATSARWRILGGIV